MKKLTLITVIIFTANLMFAQYNKIDTSFFSEALQEEKMVDVYFPPGYDENPDLCYPVIYYLHYWTGDQNTMGAEMMSWTNSLISNGTIDPVIMVCADNSPEPFDGNMYTSSVIWGNYEEYMANDLINWIESSFRAIPGRNYRGLLGHSMGGYGCWRYGTLHKDKFRVLAATAAPCLNMTDSTMSWTRTKILQQNQPGPPYFYDYYNSGSTTRGMFLFCGAFAANLNTPQTYINPQIVEFIGDEDGNYIDTIVDKLRANSIDHLIHLLTPEDSVGILYGCGTGDLSYIENHQAFVDTLESIGLPYEYYEHSGGHVMPSAFKQRALIFIDSLLMPPYNCLTKVPSNDNLLPSLKLENYPNPFSVLTTFQFELSENSFIELDIWNHLGQRVEVLLKGNKEAGKYQSHFDATNLPAGIYFCRLKVGNEMVTKKIIKTD